MRGEVGSIPTLCQCPEAGEGEEGRFLGPTSADRQAGRHSFHRLAIRHHQPLHPGLLAWWLESSLASPCL